MSEPLVWRHRTGEVILDRTRVMGILNVTPDSFSDGGRFLAPDAAVRRGLEMVEEGADIIDVGGESTRPGSDPVPADEEWRRVSPVIEGLAGRLSTPISIDTRKPDIARKAIRAGASIVNDVTALEDPGMVPVVANSAVGVVLMHLRGEPKTMQDRPEYVDVVDEVRDFLAARIRKAVGGGVPIEAIAVDPGIGFGKDLDHNLALLRHLDKLTALGRPILVGVSRKSFLKRLGAGNEASERLAGSLAAAAFAIAHGARVIRAHDVLETARVLRVIDAILGPR
jgi:dihydropteroate synthase